MTTRAHLLQAMAMAMASMMGGNHAQGQSISKRQINEEIESAKVKHKELLKKKGANEYTIAGVTVVARNYNNALKKVNRILKERQL
jgi:Na+-translocating ferredoxin:NAD+ oxidoreductase RnfG subunit